MTSAQRPDFAIAMRGYDRAQVDEFIAHQTARLGFAETRAQQAAASAASARQEVEQLRARLADGGQGEPENPPRSLLAVGERINAILEKATEAAEEVRAEAQREADRIRDEAADSGRADAERNLAELRSHHADLERRTAELTRRRDATLAELHRLRRVLESALGPVTSAGTGAPSEGTSDSPDPGFEPTDPEPETVVDLTAPGPQSWPGPGADASMSRVRRVQ